MSKFALIIFELDDIILDNYERKMATYLELGWDKKNAHDFISKRENVLKIASFNTNYVTFTASSRRNRYYEVYNRADMLKRNKCFPITIKAIKILSKDFDIKIISKRTKDLEKITIEVLKNLNFPMELLKIYFKKIHEPVQSYQRNTLIDIKSEYPTGVGLILNPSDASLLKRFDFTPVGFSSVKNDEDFNNYAEVVCQDWNQVIASLSQQ